MAFGCIMHKKLGILVHPKGDCHYHKDILGAHHIKYHIVDKNRIDTRSFVRLMVWPMNHNYLSNCMDWDVIVYGPDPSFRIPSWYKAERDTIENNAREAASEWQRQFVYEDGTYQKVRYKNGKVIWVANYKHSERHGLCEHISDLDGSHHKKYYRNGTLYRRQPWFCIM